MGHLMFYLAVVAACLLWSAAFVAAAARVERVWLRRLLAAVGWLVPPFAILPWVGLTAWFALLKFQTNWFGPTLTALVSVVIGGLWIRAAGMSRAADDGRPVAAGWPVLPLAAGFVLAKAVAFGTLLFIGNAVAAEGRMLRVEAAQMMAAALPPPPAADDDAAPLYLRAVVASAADKTLEEVKDPLAADVRSPEVAAILARHAATLDLLRRAADKPGCRFTRDWSRPSIDMLLPEVQEMRFAARLLTLAARKAAADGDTAAALADVVRIRRVGMHAATEPILICGLVGQAIDTMALQVLADVLPRLGKKDLPLLDGMALRDFVATPVSYQRHFLGEEAFGLATAADLADDRQGRSLAFLSALEGSPRTSFPLDRPLSFLYRCFMLPADEAGYRSIMRRYQNIFASLPSTRPFPEIKKQIDEIEEGIKERRDGIFTSLIAPALSNVLKTQFRGWALHEAAEVLVAATRARLADGAVPDSIAALVPDRLSAPPRDPFTADAPLLSKQVDDAWVVYSVGPDGEDDGGPPPPGAAEIAAGNDDVGLRLAP